MTMQSHDHEGRLSGGRWNRKVEHYVEWFWNRVRYAETMLLEDGYPPFHVQRTEQEQLDLLRAWRDMGDPRYWQDAEAQAELVRLETQQRGAIRMGGL